MTKLNIKTIKRNTRRKRIRAKVSGTSTIPRLAVFKSLKYIYAQLIDDERGVTLAAATSKGIKTKGKTEAAKLVGADIAKKASEKKIEKAVFDRGGYIYTGRIKALADGAREGGLVF